MTCLFVSDCYKMECYNDFFLSLNKANLISDVSDMTDELSAATEAQTQEVK